MGSCPSPNHQDATGERRDDVAGAAHEAICKMGRTDMRKVLLAWTLVLVLPMSAVAGPKEDALQVVDQFKKAFDASDVQGIVKLFAPDAVFLGTVSPKLATKTEDIDAYFQGIKTDTPRKVVFGD